MICSLMREFEYFLFENFDADKEADNPNNPRNFLGKGTNAILSEVIQSSTYARNKCSDELVRKLIYGGVLRPNEEGLAFDCPIFLREDASVLHAEIASKASALADLLENSLAEIQACCAKIDNGFPVELNLYHILCGMVFDGRFFDYLSDKGALATSRRHSSGLDYLTVIYEKCDELQSLSDGLLCSYNRLVNEKCSLQSFGDANGDRFDFYRFFRSTEQGNVPAKFMRAETLLRDGFGGPNKDAILEESISLLRTGWCAPAVKALLEEFGYVCDGIVCVPVFTVEHRKYITEIEGIVEKSLGVAVSDTLIELTNSIDITAVRHGVDQLEIANELYHIVFGAINEELATRGIVAAPQHISGEGRYLKCIELY